MTHRYHVIVKTFSNSREKPLGRGAKKDGCFRRLVFKWHDIIFPVLKCPEPKEPKNGELSCSDHSYRGMCSIKCNPGYSLNGPSVRRCVTSGDSVKWTGSTPTCQSK